MYVWDDEIIDGKINGFAKTKGLLRALVLGMGQDKNRRSACCRILGMGVTYYLLYSTVTVCSSTVRFRIPNVPETCGTSKPS